MQILIKINMYIYIFYILNYLIIYNMITHVSTTTSFNRKKICRSICKSIIKSIKYHLIFLLSRFTILVKNSKKLWRNPQLRLSRSRWNHSKNPLSRLISVFLNALRVAVYSRKVEVRHRRRNGGGGSCQGIRDIS